MMSKKLIRVHLNMSENVVDLDHQILTVSYAGTELDDSWVFSHLGMRNGVTVKVAMRQQIKPVLFVHCSYNNETLSLYRDIQLGTLEVGPLKTIIARKTGIPVGAFRLLNAKGLEMFDCHMLDRYNVDIGDTIKLITWDGWNDFLKLASMGYTSHVMKNLAADEFVARYQMRVALAIAAFFGHVDLSVSLLRQGVRADDPVGEHPVRQWCSETSHKDVHKTPIHIASETGQLGVLRTFVTNSICSILAKDGNGLTPLSIALRTRQKACAMFLLTKQWSRVPVNKENALSLAVYAKIRRWSERAKNRVFLLHGMSKSSIKKRHVTNAPLVSNGVSLDGFSFTKSSIPSKDNRTAVTYDGLDDPEIYFRQIGNISRLRRQRSKAFKMGDKVISHSSPDKDKTIKLPLLPTIPKMVTLQNPVSVNKYDSNQKQGDCSTRITTPSSSASISPKNQGTSISNSFIQSDTKQNFDSHKKDKRAKNTITKPNSKAPKLKALSHKQLSQNTAFPLPPITVNDTRHPDFIYIDGLTRHSENLAQKTLNSYEKYRGMPARTYAIRCMVLASKFDRKPWLERVRMAVFLNSKAVKKNTGKYIDRPSPTRSVFTPGIVL